MAMLTIHLSRPELSIAKAEAKAAGASLAGYCRAVLTGSRLAVPTPCAVDREALAAVEAMGPRVLRIHAAADNKKTDPDDLATVEELAFALVEIRGVLLAKRTLDHTPTGRLPSGSADASVDVTLNDAEHKAVVDAAASIRVSASAWARAVLVAAPRISAMKPVVTEADRDALRNAAIALTDAAAGKAVAWLGVRQAHGLVIQVMERVAPAPATVNASEQ